MFFRKQPAACRRPRWRAYVPFLLLTLTARLSMPQTIEAIAGTGAPGFAGDGGDARAALLDTPRALALHPSTGDLFIVDYSNNRIRQWDPRGVITTVAGNGEIAPLAEGPALRSPFIALYGVGWHSGEGKLYIAESGGLLSVDSAGGLRSVMADRAVPVLSPAASGNGVLFSDFLSVQRREANGAVVSLAGADEPGDSGDGGPATDARFTFITSLAQDRVGRIWVADAESRRVRRFLPGGAIETVAGGPDDPDAFGKPAVIAVDIAGNLYIADSNRFRIYRVPAGSNRVEPFAGDGREESRGDGGLASDASFEALSGMAVNCSGVFVSDANRVRRIVLTNPLIALRGITDAGSGEAILRPGRGFAIEGCHLATTTTRADEALPLPLRLADVEVLFDGVPVPLVSASPGRLEARLPEGLATAPSATIRVNVTGAPPVEVRVDVRQ